MIWFWMILIDIILNVIERYNFEWYWKIWYSIWLKDMILNSIEWYDFQFHKNLWKILRILMSSMSFVNKSLMISMFSFSIAKYNAVL